MMLIKNKAIKANKHRTSHPFVPKEEFQLISLRFGAGDDGTRRQMKIFWSFCCEKIFSVMMLGMFRRRGGSSSVCERIKV